jgi:hypothetical protein
MKQISMVAHTHSNKGNGVFYLTRLEVIEGGTKQILNVTRPLVREGVTK